MKHYVLVSPARLALGMLCVICAGITGNNGLVCRFVVESVLTLFWITTAFKKVDR